MVGTLPEVVSKMSDTIKVIPQGVCSDQISFKITDGKINNVKFVNGCAGNAQGISRLVEGMDAVEVVRRLRGIKCQNGTSCPDQLAVAVEKVIQA